MPRLTTCSTQAYAPATSAATAARAHGRWFARSWTGCRWRSLLDPTNPRRERRQDMHARSLTVLLALCTALGTMAAHAQPYPSRPIAMIVPSGPAGAVASVARVFAQYLGQQIGQTIVGDNRPGARGNNGTDAAAKAPPNGYTLLMAA